MSSERLSVTDANSYGLKTNRPRGVLGRKAIYNSLEFGPRRLDGSLPGEVKLDSDVGAAEHPVTKSTGNNCGCK